MLNMVGGCSSSLMLPDVHNIPSDDSERFIRGSVTLDVAIDLRLPPFPVVLGPRPVLRTAASK
jgi:hypothetical protein